MSDYGFKPRISETLSAFLDGEASPDEIHHLLDDLHRDPQLQTILEHHHRLRASLRGELHPKLDAGFVGRVMAGLDGSESRSTRLMTLPATRRLSPWMRGTLGLAMAASFAAVAVLAVQVLLPFSDPVFAPVNSAAQSVPRAPVHETASVAAIAPRHDTQPWNDLSPDAAAELNNYLISHNNSAMDHGLGGSMGFMRVAARDGVDSSGAQR